MLGALEHHVFEQVRKTGTPGYLVGWADVVPQVDRHHWQAVILRENYFQAVGELVLLKFDLGQIRCVAFRRLDLRHLLRWRWAGGQTAGEEEQQEKDELCFSHSGSPEWWQFRSEERRVGKECRWRWAQYHSIRNRH